MLPTDAAASFQRFLHQLPAQATVAVVCHSDADGLSAGAIVTLTLQRLGFLAAPLVTRKFENPWDASLIERLAATDAAALVVCDSGIRPQELLPGTPTCLIDHHQYEAAPPGAVVISGYGSEPCPTSSLLAWWAAPEHLREDLLWLALLGLVGDLGEKAPFPELKRAKEVGGVTNLRKATSALNGYRRAAQADHDLALRILLHAGGPKELLSDALPEATALRAAKAEVDGALAVAKRVGPKVVGQVALICIDTPCQIHSLVAQLWRFRLADKVVICANLGYHEGWVHFSARSARPLDLIQFLRQYTPAGAGENFAKGHKQATGGSLPQAVWEDFRARLGFSSSAPSDRTEPAPLLSL